MDKSVGKCNVGNLQPVSEIFIDRQQRANKTLPNDCRRNDDILTKALNLN